MIASNDPNRRVKSQERGGGEAGVKGEFMTYVTPFQIEGASI